MNAAAGDFLLPVDKPEGPTSHDIVAAARRALRTRRVGHTGTLDPFASGLLVLCVGRATRLAEYVSGFDKRYLADARLGVETDTLDREGDVRDRSDSWKTLTASDVERSLGDLCGPIDQVPPQYSAKKVDGEAMHRRARRGEQVDLEPVRITVREIGLVSVELPDIRFDVRCSTGTYVRALARDLGRDLGVGAHLTALRRTALGPWTTEDALPLGALDDDVAVARATIEPLAALRHLPTVEASDEIVSRILNGQRIRLDPSWEVCPAADPSVVGTSGPPLVTVAQAGSLVAIAELEAGVLRPRKVFPS